MRASEGAQRRESRSDQARRQSERTQRSDGYDRDREASDSLRLTVRFTVVTHKNIFQKGRLQSGSSALHTPLQWLICAYRERCQADRQILVRAFSEVDAACFHPVKNRSQTDAHQSRRLLWSNHHRAFRAGRALKQGPASSLDDQTLMLLDGDFGSSSFPHLLPPDLLNQSLCLYGLDVASSEGLN